MANVTLPLPNPLPVTYADLLAPAGDLVAAVHFPGETDGAVAERLGGYLADGARRIAAALGRPTNPVVLDDAGLADALTAWAYHRANRATYARLVATPATVSVQGEASTTFLMAQIAGVKAAAEGYLAAFLALVPEPVVTPAATSASRVRASSSVATSYGW